MKRLHPILIFLAGVVLAFTLPARAQGIVTNIIGYVNAAGGTQQIDYIHPLPVGGALVAPNDTFARPADTTAYTAGDAVAAATTDSGTTPLRGIVLSRNIGSGLNTGYITGIRLWTDQAGNTARFRIHFYTVAQPTDVIPGDNVPMTLRWNNFAQRIGTWDMPAMATETNAAGSTAAHSSDFTLRIPFVCTGSSTTVYYRWEAIDAFTPNSGQQFGIALSSDQN